MFLDRSLRFVSMSWIHLRQNTLKNKSLFCPAAPNNHSLYQRTDARRERWSTIPKKNSFFSYNTNIHWIIISLPFVEPNRKSVKSWIWKVSEYKIVHYLYCSLGFVCLSIFRRGRFLLLVFSSFFYFSVSSELFYWTALKSRQTKQ